MSVHRKDPHPAATSGSRSARGKRAKSPPPLETDYRTLFHQAFDAILLADTGGRIIEANRAATRLTKRARVELLQMELTDLFSESLRVEADQCIRAVTSSKDAILPTVMVTAGGKDIAVEVSISLSCPSDEDMLTAVIRDVSEQRSMMEQLDDALQRLRFHVARMPLAYIIFDTEFRIVEWNAAAERIFGFPKAEMIGRHPYEVIVPPDAQASVTSVLKDLLAGDTSSHSINANLRKDGSRLTCEWFNTPLRDANGEIKGVASMAMDVSEREIIEAQLRNTQRLESLGVLASGVAHDFNSSLMVILGNTALLRGMKDLPSRAIEYIEPIESAGARANDLIKNLLAYARTGRHNPQPTDLNDLVHETLGFVRASLGPGFALDLRLAKRLPKILADRSQIEQVITNLCANASQAMGLTGTIGITTRERELTAKQIAACVPSEGTPGPHVEIVVADTGCGMDTITAHRIFDPFYTTKPDGHGLGLASVLGILRQHGARARVESTPGHGTKIHVCFPVYREHAR